MSGETGHSVSGWTTDTLNSFLTQILEERDKRFNDRFDAADAASIARHLLLETRLEGMDKATELLSTTVNRVPTDVDKQVAQLKAVHDERFTSVDERIDDLKASMVVRFEERDTRSEREARDNKIAVDAAFAAAKEAVAENNKSSALANDKSEASFTKQIDAILLLIDSRAKASDDKIDDLKQQIVDLRTGASNSIGHSAGAIDARTVIFAIIGMLLAATGIIITLIAHKP